MNQGLESYQHVELAKKRENYTMNIVRKNNNEIPPMSEQRAEEIQAMSDEDIDFSDIPELDEEFFQKAELVNTKLATEVIDIQALNK